MATFIWTSYQCTWLGIFPSDQSQLLKPPLVPQWHRFHSPRLLLLFGPYQPGSISLAHQHWKSCCSVKNSADFCWSCMGRTGHNLACDRHIFNHMSLFKNFEPKLLTLGILMRSTASPGCFYLLEGKWSWLTMAKMISTISHTYTGLLNSSLKNFVGLPAFNARTMNCRKSRRETGEGGWGP